MRLCFRPRRSLFQLHGKLHKMSETQAVLTAILNWAESEEPIRALILDGSRASNSPVDELADFDIKLFTRTHEPYTRSDEWLSAIGEVWVWIPEQYDLCGAIIPVRLVIFRAGVKVDFSFVDVHLLDKLAVGHDWNAGYKVLLDKDGAAAVLPAPTFQPAPHAAPSAEDFRRVVDEFWFEVYHVAKYLKREELWLVKLRDWATKDFLLKMIEWHAQSRHGWSHDTAYAGKHIRAWAGEDVWRALQQVFARFDAEDSWSGLLATINLFRRLAVETAEQLRLEYPFDVDRDVTGYVLKLKSQCWPGERGIV